jgi:hypothetical protein
MAYRSRHWQVFDEHWFQRNQRWLRWCVNMSIVGRWFRRILSLRLAMPVTLITPDAVHYREDGLQSIAHCYPFPYHSRAIYDALKPLWWGMHYWDELIADRWLPELSFGFDQLTVYTGKTQVQDFDGTITSIANTYFDARQGNEQAQLVASIGISDNVDAILSFEASRSGSNEFTVSRSYLRFNLSSIPIGNRVTGSNLYIAPLSVQNHSGFFAVISSWPALDGQTTLTSSDWATSTVTASSTSPLRLGAYSLTTLNNYVFTTPDYAPGFALNANGLAYLQGRAGTYANLCVRHNRDTDNVAPVGTSLITLATFAASEYRIGSTYYGPYLEVTYQRVVLANGFTVTAVFGLPTLTQTQPIVTPVGFEVTVTFGQPALRGSTTTVNLNGFVVTATFGTVQGSTIQAIGLAVPVTFGTPQIPIIQATGLPITVTFGEVALVRGQIVRPNGFAVTATFGTITVGAVPWIVSPAGIPINVQFGFVAMESPYPDGEQFTGPYIARLIDQPIQFDSVTYEYEDGTATVNVQPAGLRQWVLEYEGLTEAELSQLVNHYNAMRGRSATFSFYHRRDNVTYTNVRYASMSIDNRSRKWVNGATVVLEKMR